MAPRKKSLTSKLQEVAGNNPVPTKGNKKIENASLIPLEQIKDRTLEETRTTDEQHVEALALSIAALGLIEPLVVDAEGVLLAGGHRKAAITLLQQKDPDAYQGLFGEGVPVRVMGFSASVEPDQALAIEIAENEIRRDYSKDEVVAIAKRLKSAGFEELKGRPPDGKRPLMPALSAVVGKSIRQLRRIINEDETKNKSGTHDPLSNADKQLQKAIAALEKWEKLHGRKRREIALAKNLDTILQQLRDGLE